MWLNESLQFPFGSAETVQKSEIQLKKELEELKSEIETNEIIQGNKLKKSFSSVSIPPDPKVLENERKFCIERLLQVMKHLCFGSDTAFKSVSHRVSFCIGPRSQRPVHSSWCHERTHGKRFEKRIHSRKPCPLAAPSMSTYRSKNK